VCCVLRHDATPFLPFLRPSKARFLKTADRSPAVFPPGLSSPLAPRCPPPPASPPSSRGRILACHSLIAASRGRTEFTDRKEFPDNAESPSREGEGEASGR